MNKKSKNQIKESFFGIKAKLDSNSKFKSELMHSLKKQTSIVSCCLSYQDFTPNEIFINASEKDIKLLGKNNIELYNLHLEIEHHIVMLDEIEKLVNNRIDLRPNLLLNIHHNFYKRTHYNLGGNYRNCESPLTDKPRPHYHMLPEQTGQHLKWLENRLELIGLVTPDNFFEIFHIASEIIYRIAISSPFSIGNGIFSRMLSDYVLLKTNLFYNPLIFKNYKSYIIAFDNTTFVDVSPLTEFMLENFSQNLELIKKEYDIQTEKIN